MSLNPTRDLREFISAVYKQLAEVLKRLVHIEKELHKMPTRAQLDQAKADLRQTIIDETTQVTNAIQALIDQVNSGTPATEQDLQDILDDANLVKGVLPDPVPPTG